LKKSNAQSTLKKMVEAKEDNKLRERVIRKSYALTKQDLENIKLIKDKCLNQKVVLSDSHVIRLAIGLAVKLSDDALIKASLQTTKIITGRPKGS
jgi:hypothetical protein